MNDFLSHRHQIYFLALDYKDSSSRENQAFNIAQSFVREHNSGNIVIVGKGLGSKVNEKLFGERVRIYAFTDLKDESIAMIEKEILDGVFIRKDSSITHVAIFYDRRNYEEYKRLEVLRKRLKKYDIN